MPGRLFLTAPGAEVARWLGWAAEAPELVPRRNIAPGQEVLALTERGLILARWGIVPVGRVNARGRPVMETIVNARSETVFDKTAFLGVTRAVIPAQGWYEWTGPARRKTAWRLERADGGVLAFAAICDVWVAPGGQEVVQVAPVTCAPSAEVAAIHHRMGVILTADQVPVWMGPDQASASALCRPPPEGSLRIGEVTDVDWDAP